MATIERALELAAKAHAGMQDKQGQPYVLHPIRVMMGVEDPTSRIVAILHDVVEDSDMTLEDIKAEGFTQEVIEALSSPIRRISLTQSMSLPARRIRSHGR